MLRRVTGRMLVAWLAWRILGPEPRPRFVGSQSRPMRLPGRTVFVGDREMFVRDTGRHDLPPLLLIHGWSFDGEMTYHRIIPALSDRFRVIVPDLRNHGRSEWVRGRYDVDDLADDVAGVLRELDVTDVMVVGYSLGGMVAQALARRHPLLVGRLVLAATAAHPIDGTPRRVAAKVGFFLGRAAARVSRAEFARGSLVAVERSAGLEPRHRRWLWSALMRRDASLFYEAGQAAWRFDSRDWVGRLGRPVTVVINDRDQIVPTERQRELAALVPDAVVVTLEGVGHESILSIPERYVELINDSAQAGSSGDRASRSIDMS